MPHTNPSACKTSTPTVKRGCITISLGIMSLTAEGSSIRIRLGYGAGRICTGLHQIRKAG